MNKIYSLHSELTVIKLKTKWEEFIIYKDPSATGIGAVLCQFFLATYNITSWWRSQQCAVYVEHSISSFRMCKKIWSADLAVWAWCPGIFWWSWCHIRWPTSRLKGTSICKNCIPYHLTKSCNFDFSDRYEIEFLHMLVPLISKFKDKGIVRDPPTRHFGRLFGKSGQIWVGRQSRKWLTSNSQKVPEIPHFFQLNHG